MKTKRFWNTKKRGMVEFLFYKEKNRYIGVCLTFDIVEEGKDLKKLRQSLEESARLHLKVVIKKNLSEDLLNRYAPEKYWRKYFKFQELIEKQKSKKREIPAILKLPYPLVNAACAGR